MKKSKILIHNFYDYCGGGIVLSELCKTLRQLGYDARLIVTKTNPLNEQSELYLKKKWVIDSLLTILIIIICDLFPFRKLKEKYKFYSIFPDHLTNTKRQWLPIVNKKKDIIIYPETVYGNPFEVNKVVRWQLNHYLHFNDKKAYSYSDLFLGYREIFNDRAHTPHVENVLISGFNTSLYCRTNYGERNGKCYIIRKGINRTDLPEKFDGIIIDDLPETEIVKVFNSCEYCYSYDTQTFYSSIAAICGCKSIVVPEPGKSIKDYRNPSEPSHGVAWNDNEDEINRALNSVDKLIKSINNFNDNNTIAAKKLIIILEKKFNVRVARCQLC